MPDSLTPIEPPVFRDARYTALCRTLARPVQPDAPVPLDEPLRLLRQYVEICERLATTRLDAGGAVIPDAEAERHAAAAVQYRAAVALIEAMVGVRS